VTVLFSVEPSHNPSGSLTPSVLTPSAENAAAALQLDPVDHQRREARTRGSVLEARDACRDAGFPRMEFRDMGRGVLCSRSDRRCDRPSPPLSDR
jgi:hypothetical protein